jgi:hypothetical protein
MRVEKKETYDAKKACNRRMKLRQTDLFVSYLNKDSRIALLDCPLNNSAKAARNIGISKENIHIPNFDKDVVSVLQQNDIGTPFHTTMGEFIDSTQTTYDGLLLDYCGSWNGNKSTGIDMKKDIKNVFAREILNRQGVMTVTMSWHGMKKKMNLTAQRIVKCIEKFASSNGYELKNKIAEFYGKPAGGDEMILGVNNSSSMLFLLFENA